MRRRYDLAVLFEIVTNHTAYASRRYDRSYGGRIVFGRGLGRTTGTVPIETTKRTSRHVEKFPRRGAAPVGLGRLESTGFPVKRRFSWDTRYYRTTVVYDSGRFLRGGGGGGGDVDDHRARPRAHAIDTYTGDRYRGHILEPVAGGRGAVVGPVFARDATRTHPDVGFRNAVARRRLGTTNFLLLFVCRRKRRSPSVSRGGVPNAVFTHVAYATFRAVMLGCARHVRGGKQKRKRRRRRNLDARRRRFRSREVFASCALCRPRVNRYAGTLKCEREVRIGGGGP